MTLIEFLSEDIKIFTILHLIGVVLGLGTATITDILFFKFLKDNKISRAEAGIMKTLSGVIWVALLILLVSGIGLYIPQAARLSISGKFLVKVCVLGVIFVNGLFLNFYAQPRIQKITFSGQLPEIKRRTRKIFFVLGGISISSWWFVFILGSLRGVLIPFRPLLLVYVCLLAVAVIGSQVFEYRINKAK